MHVFGRWYIPRLRPLHADAGRFERAGYAAEIEGCSYRVSFLRAGACSGARVILIHGSPGRAHDWGELLADPPDGCELIAIDRLGFGETTPLRGVRSLEQHALSVEPLLEDADDRPIILVGFSYGGPVAARLAADHPGRIAGLVLVGAGLDPDLETIELHQRFAALPLAGRFLPAHLRHANNELMRLERDLRELAPGLGQISARTALVHGNADDRVPFANVRYAQRMLTGAHAMQTVACEGLAHALPWLAPDRIRAGIEWAMADPRDT